MKRIITAILLICILLMGPGNTLAQSQLQHDRYTLSAEALAAAQRFSSNPKQRAYADIELIVKELSKPVTPEGAQYQVISKRELITLLGTPTHEAEDSSMMYGHQYGTTSFYFENDRLKSAMFLGEPNYWYSSPYRMSVFKRVWYKARNWSRKIKKLVF